MLKPQLLLIDIKTNAKDIIEAIFAENCPFTIVEIGHYASSKKLEAPQAIVISKNSISPQDLVLFEDFLADKKFSAPVIILFDELSGLKDLGPNYYPVLRSNLKLLKDHLKTFIP